MTKFPYLLYQSSFTKPVKIKYNINSIENKNILWQKEYFYLVYILYGSINNGETSLISIILLKCSG